VNIEEFKKEASKLMDELYQELRHNELTTLIEDKEDAEEAVRFIDVYIDKILDYKHELERMILELEESQEII